VSVRLRDLREDDIPDALGLSRAAGWNQREADWRGLLALNPGRFVAAESDGRVVGTGGAACYGAALAWICMILVEESSRGAGLGTRLVSAVLERVRDVAVVGLDATPQGQPVYERLGFRDCGLVLRMEAREPRIDLASSAIRELPKELKQEMLREDALVFGADRGAALRWLRQHGRGWFAEATSYAFLREGEHSLHVGPVVAESVDTAELLVQAAIANGPRGRVILDAPTHDAEWLGRLRALGFVEKRRLARMYLSPGGPAGRPQAVRALFGPEFG
jgi:GNAT superfamily N-acetyltransferase